MEKAPSKADSFQPALLHSPRQQKKTETVLEGVFLSILGDMDTYLNFNDYITKFQVKNIDGIAQFEHYRTFDVLLGDVI